MKILKRLQKGFLIFLSKIQYHKFPFFLIYDLKGYRFKKTHEIINSIQPGDIILRKYDNYVTGLMIPGQWKHAGMVIDKETVVHSIETGVQYENIIQFCRTDAICVLRVPKLTKKKKDQIVSIVLSQLGKPYDFDFKPSADKFYCSELIAYAIKEFVSIDPQPKKLFGFIPTWPAISPNDLYKSTLLEIIYIQD